MAINSFTKQQQVAVSEPVATKPHHRHEPQHHQQLPAAAAATLAPPTLTFAAKTTTAFSSACDKADGGNQISEFYANKRILITGGTGFIGKVLIEKLLYSCPGVTKIYLLMRSSNGKSAKERLSRMLAAQPFTFRLESEKIVQKVEAIECDLEKPQIGLSKQQFDELANCVDIIFHVAASVKFEETIKFNFVHNVLTTRNVLELARVCSEGPNFKCFVHVSTAYSHCQLRSIDERVYKMPLPENLNPSHLNDSLEVLQGRPNSYTYTKALAESLVDDYATCVRNIAIARPSIVMTASAEPCQGWVDTINGPVGLSVLGALGILQTLKVNSTVVFDLMPVDTVANALVSIGWAISEHGDQFKSGAPQEQQETIEAPLAPETATAATTATKLASETTSTTANTNNNNINEPNQQTANNSEEQQRQHPTVFNLTSGTDNPCSFHRYFHEGTNWSRQSPSIRAMRPILSIPYQLGMSNVRYVLTTFFTHILFGYVADLLLKCAGQKKMVMKAVNRMHHANDILHFFCANQWKFGTQNMRTLHNLKSGADSRDFQSDPRDLNWSSYAYASWMGCRRFILKESDDNIAAAKKRYEKVVFMYKAAKVALLVAALLLLQLTFQYWNNSLTAQQQISTTAITN